jgi:hypothetical protein
MSLSSDIATLASQGFAVTSDTGRYRLVRVGVDHAQAVNGDLGVIDGSSGLQGAVTSALSIVSAILADEAARALLPNPTLSLGVAGSWQPYLW